MILGTGIDIVEVSRIAEKLSNKKGLLEQIFAASEIAYCEGKPGAYEHFAARFAAKEAFLKATGKGLNAGFDLFNIVVDNDEQGKPFLSLHGRFAEMAKAGGWGKIHISISHTETMACASVIIER
jgi:holo-[acyl-carrier protein] synthase